MTRIQAKGMLTEVLTVNGSQRPAVATAIVLAALVAVFAVTTACQRNGSIEKAPEAQATAEPARVNVQQVKEWMDEDVHLAVLDSRSDGGWQAAGTKATGAIRVPPHDVAAHISSIPRDARVIVYCT